MTATSEGLSMYVVVNEYPDSFEILSNHRTVEAARDAAISMARAEKLEQHFDRRTAKRRNPDLFSDIQSVAYGAAMDLGYIVKHEQEAGR